MPVSKALSNVGVAVDNCCYDILYQRFIGEDDPQEKAHLLRSCAYWAEMDMPDFTELVKQKLAVLERVRMG